MLAIGFHPIKGNGRDDGWRLSDDLWERIRALLPPPKFHPWGMHNPRVDDRSAMDAIFFVLRTGCQWNALNETGICTSSSAHRRFKEWTEGNGLPIGLVVDGANRNDMKLVRATLESIPVQRPEPTPEAPQGLCLDKGYDFDEVRELVRTFGFTAHIRARGEEARAIKEEAGIRARARPPLRGRGRAEGLHAEWPLPRKGQRASAAARVSGQGPCASGSALSPRPRRLGGLSVLVFYLTWPGRWN